MLKKSKSPHEKCYRILKLRMKSVFEMDYGIERILSALIVERGKKIEAEHILLIFDEMRGFQGLKCAQVFYENAKRVCYFCSRFFALYCIS